MGAVPIVAQPVKALCSLHEVSGRIPWAYSVKYGIAASCSVGHRYDSDLVLAVAVASASAAAQIQPLPGNFHMLQVWPYKEKKEKKKSWDSFYIYEPLKCKVK